MSRPFSATRGMSDAALLARFEPVIRFNAGEYFLPASVESFIARCELWDTANTGNPGPIAQAGTLDLDRLVDLTAGSVARHHLRLVTQPATWSESVAWRRRRDRPRFRPETRLGRVGVLTRVIDAGARASLLTRGSTPRGAQVAAVLSDRDRPDHGDHPYYGHVVRNAGFTVLQYWFFYYFNDWRSRAHGVNDHEGDWEQVTVYLAGDQELTPEWVAFSAHDEVGADLRRRWDDPDVTIVDEHPVVHAGLGSHAGAALAGEYLVTVRHTRLARVRAIAGSVSRLFQPWIGSRQSTVGLGVPFVEYARGDGVTIGPGSMVPWRQVVVDDTTPWVRGYTGLWGNDTKDRLGGERGPAGPRYERDGTVRTSWADPVGWASLDAVSPNEDELRQVLSERLDELAIEADELEVDRERRRRRLRADAIGGVADTDALEVELAALAVRALEVADAQSHLRSLSEGSLTVEAPHAHLRHRAMPLPTESRDRRRLLRIWATISTPLLFIFAALLVDSGGPSLVVTSLIGIVVVIGIESLTRGELRTYAVRLVLICIIAGAGWFLVLALLDSWRSVSVIVLLFGASILLISNLRELRRN